MLSGYLECPRLSQMQLHLQLLTCPQCLVQQSSSAGITCMCHEQTAVEADVPGTGQVSSRGLHVSCVLKAVSDIHSKLGPVILFSKSSWWWLPFNLRKQHLSTHRIDVSEVGNGHFKTASTTSWFEAPRLLDQCIACSVSGMSMLDVRSMLQSVSMSSYILRAYMQIASLLSRVRFVDVVW